MEQLTREEMEQFALERRLNLRDRKVMIPGSAEGMVPPSGRKVGEVGGTLSHGRLSYLEDAED